MIGEHGRNHVQSDAMAVRGLLVRPWRMGVGGGGALSFLVIHEADG